MATSLGQNGCLPWVHNEMTWNLTRSRTPSLSMVPESKEDALRGYHRETGYDCRRLYPFNGGRYSDWRYLLVDRCPCSWGLFLSLETYCICVMYWSTLLPVVVGVGVGGGCRDGLLCLVCAGCCLWLLPSWQCILHCRWSHLPVLADGQAYLLVYGSWKSPGSYGMPGIGGSATCIWKRELEGVVREVVEGDGGRWRQTPTTYTFRHG